MLNSMFSVPNLPEQNVDVVVIQEEASSGSAAGNSGSNGIWFTRAINSIYAAISNDNDYNIQGNWFSKKGSGVFTPANAQWVTLDVGNKQFTLQSGKYELEGLTTGINCGSLSAAFLVVATTGNVGNGLVATSLWGGMGQNPASGGALASVKLPLQVSGTITLQLQVFTGSAGTNTNGQANTTGQNEVYSQIIIRKYPDPR